MESDIKGVVTKAKAKRTHFVGDEFTLGRKFSGFFIGKGNPLLARIYNKTLEIKSTSKIWFRTIWKENDWDGIKDV
jgi:hypothetical protein